MRGVDEKQGLVFFEAFRETVLERHLYSVPLDGGEIRRITREPGWHETTVADDGRHFVDSFSGPETPPRTSLCRIDGTLVAHVRENPLVEGHPYFPYLSGHLQRQLGTLEADDGTTLTTGCSCRPASIPSVDTPPS